VTRPTSLIVTKANLADHLCNAAFKGEINDSAGKRGRGRLTRVSARFRSSPFRRFRSNLTKSLLGISNLATAVLTAVSPSPRLRLLAEERTEMRRGRYLPPRLRRCKDRGGAAAGRLFLYAGEGKSVQGSAELGHRAPLSRSRGKYSPNMLLTVSRCALSRKDARIATRDLSPIRFRGVKTGGMECLSPSGLRIHPRDLSPSRAFVFSGRRAPLIRERFLTRC